ncbi:PREDICTED: anthocyanidin 3-O-glucosyltransferase 2-like [Ipomoea nil]|uniref:anthocyanidin 3-O-glucosyltransferase 2-like n=1 Tax=Ipomoea nil TaxID=35883 RepID=UPI000901DCA2|nr:PREDICTED: anthocyanidin 3-O-glucosyltransferase 2-like [Ipomoea nil]
MENAAEVIFIPGHGMGHLVPAVEMGKLLTSRAEWISVTFLIIGVPFGTGVDSYTQSLSQDAAGARRLRFLSLPPPPPQRRENAAASSSAQDINAFDHISAHKPAVRDVISDFSGSGRVIAGVVVDMFSADMIDVADEFGLPSYVFYTSGAGFLGLKFYAQTLKDDHGRDISDYRDSEAELAVPSFSHPVPAKVLPTPMLDKYGLLLVQHCARMIRRAKGILINTFLELEAHAIASLSDGKFPSVYPVGPLINHPGGGGDDEEVKRWLDEQPPSSVVFLCFGSYGSFSAEQVKEIAAALQRGGWRFLWCLRRPKVKGEIGAPGDYSDPKEILPETFLERTQARGKVIGWAAQMMVLSHPSIGGFVSHCGWNSILESVWCGVPVAAWPMYAEQQINAFELVVELEMGVDIKMEYRSDTLKSPEEEEDDGNIQSPVIVSADEIECGIRKLMEDGSNGDHGRIIRKKMKDMKEKSRLALLEGGSSYNFLGHFINDLAHQAKSSQTSRIVKE